jgi:hypothetical protein
MLTVAGRAASAALVLLLGAAAPATAGSYTYTTIDFAPGGTNTLIRGVNPAAVVTGSYTGGDGLSHGFIWSAGHFTAFDAPNSAAGSTLPVAINARGQVVENFLPFLGGNETAFVRESNGTQHQLPFPPAAAVAAAGINRAGAVVGTVAGVAAQTVGFLLADGKVTLLHVPGAATTQGVAINDAGVVLGSFIDATGTGAFTYKAGSYTIFRAPHLTPVTTSAIDTAGLVFGSYLREKDNGLIEYDVGFTFNGTAFRSFRSAKSINTYVAQAFGAGYYVGTAGPEGLPFGYAVKGGQATTILPPGGVTSSVAGGTAAGILVGSYTDSANRTHGFMAVCAAANAPCTQ